MSIVNDLTLVQQILSLSIAQANQSIGDDSWLKFEEPLKVVNHSTSTVKCCYIVIMVKHILPLLKEYYTFMYGGISMNTIAPHFEGENNNMVLCAHLLLRKGRCHRMVKRYDYVFINYYIFRDGSLNVTMKIIDL